MNQNQLDRDSYLNRYLAVQWADQKLMAFWVCTFSISRKDNLGLSLDSALEQRRDDLALEQNKDDEGGYQNDDCTGA